MNIVKSPYINVRCAVVSQPDSNLLFPLINDADEVSNGYVILSLLIRYITTNI